MDQMYHSVESDGDPLCLDGCPLNVDEQIELIPGDPKREAEYQDEIKHQMEKAKQRSLDARNVFCRVRLVDFKSSERFNWANDGTVTSELKKRYSKYLIRSWLDRESGNIGIQVWHPSPAELDRALQASYGEIVVKSHLCVAPHKPLAVVILDARKEKNLLRACAPLRDYEGAPDVPSNTLGVWIMMRLYQCIKEEAKQRQEELKNHSSISDWSTMCDGSCCEGIVGW